MVDDESEVQGRGQAKERNMNGGRHGKAQKGIGHSTGTGTGDDDDDYW